jgi:S-adenosylmethionine/arginine decarboxylase-like enzyme
MTTKKNTIYNSNDNYRGKHVLIDCTNLLFSEHDEPDLFLNIMREIVKSSVEGTSVKIIGEKGSYFKSNVTYNSRNSPFEEEKEEKEEKEEEKEEIDYNYQYMKVVSNGETTPDGFAYVYVLNESHLSMHAYSGGEDGTSGMMAIDIFTCGGGVDTLVITGKIIKSLKEKFKSIKIDAWIENRFPASNT